MAVGGTGLDSSIQTISSSMSTSYTDLKQSFEDPNFGTNPSDLMQFQFKMNEWSTKYSAYSNSISSFFSAMKQTSQNLKT